MPRKKLAFSPSKKNARAQKQKTRQGTKSAVSSPINATSEKEHLLRQSSEESSSRKPSKNRQERKSNRHESKDIFSGGLKGSYLSAAFEWFVLVDEWDDLLDQLQKVLGNVYNIRDRLKLLPSPVNKPLMDLEYVEMGVLNLFENAQSLLYDKTVQALEHAFEPG